MQRLSHSRSRLRQNLRPMRRADKRRLKLRGQLVLVVTVGHLHNVLHCPLPIRDASGLCGRLFDRHVLPAKVILHEPQREHVAMVLHFLAVRVREPVLCPGHKYRCEPYGEGVRLSMTA